MGSLFSDKDLEDLRRGKPDPKPEPAPVVKPPTIEDQTMQLFDRTLGMTIDLFLETLKEYPKVSEACGNRPKMAYEGSQHRKAKRKYALSPDFREPLYPFGEFSNLTEGLAYSDYDKLYVSASGKLYGFFQAHAIKEALYENFKGTLWEEQEFVIRNEAIKRRNEMGKGTLIRLYPNPKFPDRKVENSRIGTYRAYLGVYMKSIGRSVFVRANR